MSNPPGQGNPGQGDPAPYECAVGTGSPSPDICHKSATEEYRERRGRRVHPGFLCALCGEILVRCRLSTGTCEQRIDLLGQRVQARFEHGIEVKIRIGKYLLPDFGELVGEPVLDQTP